MTHANAKGQGQRSLGTKVKVETDGRTEAIVLPPVPTRSVINRPENWEIQNISDESDRKISK